jgi:two-component system LytT family response regulator
MMTQREPVPAGESANDGRKRPTSALLRLRTALVGPVASTREFLTRIPIRTDGDLLLIPAARVVTIVARGERLVITTVDQSEHSVLYRLKDLEAHLDPSQFVRLSRNTIVNVDVVSRIAPESSGTNRVTLDNGQEVRMSRNQAARLRRILRELLG